MNRKFQSIITFLKKDTVLTISWILAILSAFVIHPSMDYLGYIDFRSLGILWSLMVIMAGLSANGFFGAVGSRLLLRTRKVWQLAAVLVFLCFFFGMFITNDVALLTFVPFAIFMLEECGKTELLVPIVVLQTLAANLGSMLTPIGNPQNLYLYGISGMGIGQFLQLMAPYGIVAFLLLTLSLTFLHGKSEPITDCRPGNEEIPAGSGRINVVYGILFLLALLVVARLIPYTALVAVVLVVVFFLDRKTLFSVDYALLFTFVGFFLFTGNLGNVPAIRQILTSLVSGREVVMAILVSQFISNVPAALLLSGFTQDLSALIIGVNFGGMGTLIASMASLISFKILTHAYPEKKGRYLLIFTAVCLVYLAVLLIFLAFWR